MMLLWWGAGAIGAGSVTGGAVCGARLGVLHLGKRRVPSRDYVGRGKVSVAGERGVSLGRRLVGRRRAGCRRTRRRRAGLRRRVGKEPPPWPVTGDGAPRCEVLGKVVAFQRFLERAAGIHLLAPNRPWVRHQTGE